MLITLLKKIYLIFILFPIAVCYVSIIMIYVFIQHIYEVSIIRYKKY